MSETSTIMPVEKPIPAATVRSLLPRASARRNPIPVVTIESEDRRRMVTAFGSKDILLLRQALTRDQLSLEREYPNFRLGEVWGHGNQGSVGRGWLREPPRHK